MKPLGASCCAIALLLASGCASSPMLKYGYETPAAALVPIGYAGIGDERPRFREIYCAVQADHGARLPDDRPCEQALHRLTDEAPGKGRPVHLGRARAPLRLVIVPGVLEECFKNFIQPFSDARPQVETLGFKTDLLQVSGLSGSAHNAAEIRDALEKLQLAPEERLVLLGYSKGAADVLEAVVRFPEVAARTAAVVTLAGVVSGTPLAEDVSQLTKRLVNYVFKDRCSGESSEAFGSLTREQRLSWLAANRLPTSVRYFSLAAFADREGISSILRSSYDKLALADPRNDSQVLATDALVPGGALLGYLNGDHWAVALPMNREHPTLASLFVTRSAFPREVLLEAIARFVEESLLDGPAAPPRGP